MPHTASEVSDLVEAAWALLEGDDPCPSCGEEPQEGEGLCSPECPRNALTVALRPFDADWLRHEAQAEGIREAKE